MIYRQDDEEGRFRFILGLNGVEGLDLREVGAAETDTALETGGIYIRGRKVRRIHRASQTRERLILLHILTSACPPSTYERSLLRNACIPPALGNSLAHLQNECFLHPKKVRVSARTLVISRG